MIVIVVVLFLDIITGTVNFTPDFIPLLVVLDRIFTRRYF